MSAREWDAGLLAKAVAAWARRDAADAAVDDAENAARRSRGEVYRAVAALAGIVTQDPDLWSPDERAAFNDAWQAVYAARTEAR